MRATWPRDCINPAAEVQPPGTELGSWSVVEHKRVNESNSGKHSLNCWPLDSWGEKKNDCCSILPYFVIVCYPTKLTETLTIITLVEKVTFIFEVKWSYLKNRKDVVSATKRSNHNKHSIYRVIKMKIWSNVLHPHQLLCLWIHFSVNILRNYFQQAMLTDCLRKRIYWSRIWLHRV